MNFSRKNTIPIILLFAFVIFSISNVTAQQKDFGLWSGVKINHDISKKVEFSISEEIRLNNNLGNLNEILTDLGTDFTLSSYLKLSGNLRFSKFEKNGAYYSKYRLWGGFQFDYKINRFKLFYRSYIQTENEALYKEGDNLVNYRNFRNMIKGEYNLKGTKMLPYAAAELFYDFSPYMQKEFNKLRLTAGIEIPINKRNSIECFFRTQRELNVKTPDTGYILGLFYNYEWK